MSTRQHSTLRTHLIRPGVVPTGIAFAAVRPTLDWTAASVQPVSDLCNNEEPKSAAPQRNASQYPLTHTFNRDPSPCWPLGWFMALPARLNILQ